MAAPIVITIVSAKGGVSKTTLAAALISHWRDAGKRVAGLDCDPNRGLSLLLDGVLAVDEAQITTAARAAKDDNDVIVIDVAGALARGTLWAIAAADLVIIPGRCSRLDVAEMVKMAEVITDTSDALGRLVRHLALITQVDGRATRQQAHVRKQLATFEIPTMEAVLPLRSAYQQASWGRTGPLTTPETVADAAAIVGEIAEVLELARG